jgi:hypothetical protein
VTHARSELTEPEPTTVLGMDEVRFGRVRWLPDGVRDDGTTRWRRSDPWETGFVDLAGDQALLGQIDGRSAAAVRAWLAARSGEFRDRIATVVIDPHAGYAAAVRAALPDAQLAVDHFHLIMLANKAVTGRTPAGDPRATRPPRTKDRSGLGEPPPVAARAATAVPGGVGPDVERLCRPRPQRDDPDRVDRERGAPRAVRDRRHRRTPRGHRAATVGPSTPGAPTPRSPS